MQTEMFPTIKQKIPRRVKSYRDSDWLYITPKQTTIHIMKLSISYWYNPMTKILVTIPMENMFNIMIGKKGKHKADNIFKNQQGYVSPFTRVRKVN